MATDEYGKLFKRAWGDPDYKALTLSQQALYQKLISQSDISMAGVLTLAVQRWAGQTAGLSADDIEDALEGLEATRFVVVDRDTQEVLVRAYIRRDLGWRSPQTMKGIAGAVERILSPVLRQVIAAELRRIDTTGLSEKISEKTGRSTRQVIDGLISELLADTPSEGVSDTPCHTPTDTPSDRGYGSKNESLHATATAPARATAIARATATATPVLTSVPKPSSVTREEPVDNFSTGRPDCDPHDLGLEMNR